jgi:hypothetical protein
MRGAVAPPRGGRCRARVVVVPVLASGPRRFRPWGPQGQNNLSRGDTRTLEESQGHPGPNDSGHGGHEAGLGLHLVTAIGSLAALWSMPLASARARPRSGPPLARFVRVVATPPRPAQDHLARVCPFRPSCPGDSAARTMIMWIPHLISCGIHMKSEITLDHAAPRTRTSRVGPRTALTGTTHHAGQRRWHVSAGPRRQRKRARTARWPAAPASGGRAVGG